MYRRAYADYSEYLLQQIEKTTDPKTTIGCHQKRPRRMNAFKESFRVLEEYVPAGRGICLGARFGDEVKALRELGYTDTVGIDLVPCKPWVVEGDFHQLPFEQNSFDFAFSNSLDHAFDLRVIGEEIGRVIKSAGTALWHVALNHLGHYESLLIESIEEVAEAMVGWNLVKEVEVPYETAKLTGLLFTRGM